MHKGFTLVELIVTIAVIAILAVIAAPSMSSWLKNNKIKTTQGDIAHFLNEARSNAIKSGKRIEICASSDDQLTCADTEKTEWSKGIIARQINSTAPNDTVVISKIEFNDTRLSVQAPAVLSFNNVGAAYDVYTITVSMIDQIKLSVCVGIAGHIERRAGDNCEE